MDEANRLEEWNRPEEWFSGLGFLRLAEGATGFEARQWRRWCKSDLIEEIRQRLLARRDRHGTPLLEQGFVVGHIPPLNLTAEEVERLLSTLTQATQAGFLRLSEYRGARPGL